MTTPSPVRKSFAALILFGFSIAIHSGCATSYYSSPGNYQGTGRSSNVTVNGRELSFEERRLQLLEMEERQRRQQLDMEREQRELQEDRARRIEEDFSAQQRLDDQYRRY